jgi:16S rRNA (uracil1498-N3)-methyltransferase
MYQFFVEPENIDVERKCVIIEGSDVNHIKNVLRMKTGEEIAVSNGIDGKEYRCAIASFGEDTVKCELRFIKEDGAELPSKIYLFQGLPKGDKMELVIQKAIELGVYEIIPVAMDRCVVKLDEKRAKKKVERYREIARAAAKQSKRATIPCITDVMTFKDACNYANCLNCKIIPYELADDMENTRNVINKIAPGDSVGVFIGPEGGITPEEIKMAEEIGAKSVTLGKRILRTETAGLTVLSWLVFILEGRNN